MNRVGGGDFGWAAEQARSALEAAQAQAQRQAELERARTLATTVAPALDPRNPEGPRLLGEALAQVQGLVPEARAAFASEVARSMPSPVVAGSATGPALQAAGLVTALVNQSCPPGSDRRAEMGRALLASVGAKVGGMQASAFEAAVRHALDRLRPVAAPKPSLPSAAPQDVLERAPRPIGAGWDRAARPAVTASAAAPMEQVPAAIEAASPAAGGSSVDAAGASEPSLVPSTAVAALSARARAAHEADVASDVQALSAALGAVEPAATIQTSAEGFLLGVKRVAWADAAPGLVTAPLRAVASRLGTLAAKAEAVRATLLGADAGTLKQRYTLLGTAGLMEKAALHAGTARALVDPVRGPRESLRAIAAARGEVQQARACSGEALGRLGELAGHYRGLTATISEVREVERLARQSEAELRTIGARTTVLEAVDAGAGGLSVEPSAEAAAAPGILTEEDLARLGSGLDPGKLPPQIVWTEQLVNSTCELGRQQGGVTDADGARHMELARLALGGEGGEAGGGPRPLEAPDLAAVLKMAGVPLEKVDPNQLVSAAAYVSSATSLADQQEKLRKALDSFQTLSTIGAPRLTRDQMGNQLWAMARVPWHALQKLSDTEMQRKYQEVAGALNAGPGASQIKIGKHTLKLQVGEAGQVLGTSCKKPGFLSQAWGVIKKVAPIALTAASLVFTGGTATALIRLGQGILSAIDAVKSRSLLAIATAGASIVGAGSSLFKGGAGVAGRIATIADNTARGLQGVSRIRQGDWLGGLASMGQGIAGGIGSAAGAANEGLLSAAERLAQYSTKLSAVGTGVSAFRGYTSANRALDEARRMLAAARASGDPRSVAEAEKQLQEAESQKRTSIFGAAAGALDAASLWVGDRARWDGAPVLEFGAAGLGSRLQLAGQAFRAARDVSAGDYLGAAVSGLGMGANVDAARHGGASSALTDVARMAEAGLDYHRSQRALSEAEEAVDHAEARLAAARAMGNAELVREAELALSQARRGHESAAMGGIAAGQSLIGTAQGVAADRRLRPTETAVREAMELAQKTADGLDDLQCRVDVPSAVREALAAEGRQLDEAARRFQAEMEAAEGNLDEQTAAARRYQAAADSIDQRREQVVVALNSGALDLHTPPVRPPGPAYASLRPSSSSESASADLPPAGEGPAPVPGAAPTARPVPERVGTLSIRPGMTLWEISMRTGVPVEAIRDFNAALGNDLPGDAELQIGASIHVPLGTGWQASRPKEAFEVAEMVEEANRRAQGLPPRELPQVVFREVPELPAPSEVPTIDVPHDRFVALAALENDFKAIEADVQRSGFDWLDPSTYVDTKEDRAKYAARDAYKQATDRYASVLSDPSASDQQVVEARNDLLRARGAFDGTRAVVDKAAVEGNYLTPLKEVAQSTQDAIHSFTGDVIDRIANTGAPAGLVAATTLPLHLFDNVVDFNAGLFKGGVDAIDGVSGVVAHPIDTGLGILSLAGRAADTTLEGQAARFFSDVAAGRFQSLDEAAKAWEERTNPLQLAGAKLDLATDVGRGVFAESIRLAQEGKYPEALGVLFGQQGDMVFGAGILKGGRVGRAARVSNAADTAGDAAKLAPIGEGAVDLVDDAARIANPAPDAARQGQPLLRVENAPSPPQGTHPGTDVGTLAPRTTPPPRVLESKGADVARTDRVVGSASTPSAVKTSIRPSIAEAEAYKEALRRGEIGLQRPAHANAPGTDFVTVVRDRITRQYRIVVTDVKSSTIGEFGPTRTSLSPAWLREVQEAVAPDRLNLGNPVLEAQIRAAVAHGRISIRRITVDYSAAGQGAMRGF